MPSTSKKQHNFMEAIAHSEKFAKKVGVPQSVGKDFAAADKGKKFRKGGSTNPAEAKIANPQVHHGQIQLPNVSLRKFTGMKKGGEIMAEKESKSEMRKEMKEDAAQDKKLIKKAFGMHDKQEHKGDHTNLSKLKKGGMAMKKMAKGGMAKETMGPKTMATDVEKGSNKLLKHGESGVQKRGHTRGMEERNYKTEKVQGGAKGESGTFGAAPIKMAKGGSASSRADGIASKGKTRGKYC